MRNWFENIFHKEIKLHEGDVYYHIELKRFVQIRQIHDDYIIVGGFCMYYNDAKTNISMSKVSHNFKKLLMPIKFIDQFKFAEICPIVHSWKVKEGKE